MRPIIIYERLRPWIIKIEDWMDTFETITFFAREKKKKNESIQYIVSNYILLSVKASFLRASSIYIQLDWNCLLNYFFSL